MSVRTTRVATSTCEPLNLWHSQPLKKWSVQPTALATITRRQTTMINERVFSFHFIQIHSSLAITSIPHSFVASFDTATAITVYIYILHHRKLYDAQTCLFWNLALANVKQGRESRISSHNTPEPSISDDYIWRDSCNLQPRDTVRMYGTPHRNLPRVDQLTGPETHRHHHPRNPPHRFHQTKKIRPHGLVLSRARDAKVWVRRR